MMINLVVLGKTEEKAKLASQWIVPSELVAGKYEHKYEFPGKSVVITAQPFWIGNPSPHPVSDGVLVYCNQEADLIELDALVHYYLAVPVKFIIYDGAPEQKAIEAKWTAKGHVKKSANELAEKLISAHNDLAMLISKVFNEFDKDHSNFIELGEIKALAKELGVDIPESEAKVLIGELDYNKDGKISLQEFTDWWKSGRKGKSFSLSDVVMRKIKKSTSLSLAADLLTQYGGIEELKGEEQKLVTSTFGIHANKVTSPGLLFNLALFSKGKQLESLYQGYADAVSVPATEPFLGIAFGCKNPKAVQAKLKELIDGGLAMIGGSMTEMAKACTDLKYGATSGKAIVAVQAQGPAKAFVGPVLEKLRTSAVYNTPNQMIDLYLSFATDLQKLITEDKPFYELILQGIALEFKSQVMENCMKLISKGKKAIKSKLHCVPGEIRGIVEGMIGATEWIKAFRGELDFEIGPEHIAKISEPMEGTPFKMPLKDLKQMVAPMIKSMIESMPVLTELHQLLQNEITSIELFVYGGGLFGVKALYDLPGLGEFIKLD